MNQVGWTLVLVTVLCGSAEANPFLKEARTLASRGAYDAALAALERAATWQEPGQDTDAQTALERGLIYVQMDRPLSARRAFTDALGKNPQLTLPITADPRASELFAQVKNSLASKFQPSVSARAQLEPWVLPPSPADTRVEVKTTSLTRPPAQLRSDRITLEAQLWPVFYWHRLGATGRAHITPMALPGAHLESHLRWARFHVGVEYGFAAGGVLLSDTWVTSQLHDLTATLGWEVKSWVFDVGYVGTWTQFENHFPRHLSNDSLHRARLGAAWRTAFYLFNVEAQLEVKAQVYPYARLFEKPVVSGSNTAGWGLGGGTALQLPLAGRVHAVVGLDARWTLIRPTGLSSRPSFNLEQVSSVQQVLLMGTLGILLPF